MIAGRRAEVLQDGSKLWMPGVEQGLLIPNIENLVFGNHSSPEFNFWWARWRMALLSVHADLLRSTAFAQSRDGCYSIEFYSRTDRAMCGIVGAAI